MGEYFYSAQLAGFLSSDLLDPEAMPADAVPVTNERRLALLAGEAAGQIIVPDSEGFPTLQSLPAALTPIVPTSVTMMQARLAMLSAGLLDKAQDALDAMEGDEGKAARIQWQYASEVRRDWPLVASLQTGLGLTDTQVDQLFITAAAIG